MDGTSNAVRMRKLSVHILLVLSISTAVPAQQPLTAYEIPAGEALSMDGSLDDWRGLSIPATLSEQQFTVYRGIRSRTIVRPPGAPTLTFNVYLAWTAEPSRIYVAYELRDDDYFDTSDGVWPSMGIDLVVIGVDGDNGGGRLLGFSSDDCFVSVEDAIQHEAWDCIGFRYFNQRIAQLYEIAPRPDGFAVWAQTRPGILDWVLEPQFTAAAGQVVDPGAPTHTVIEVMVTPFDSLDFRGPEYSTVSALRAGQTIGMQVSVADAGPGGRDDRDWYFLGDRYSYSHADTYVDILLAPAARRTALERMTWGRMKAETTEPDSEDP